MPCKLIKPNDWTTSVIRYKIESHWWDLLGIILIIWIGFRKGRTQWPNWRCGGRKLLCHCFTNCTTLGADCFCSLNLFSFIMATWHLSAVDFNPRRPIKRGAALQLLLGTWLPSAAVAAAGRCVLQLCLQEIPSLGSCFWGCFVTFTGCGYCSVPSAQSIAVAVSPRTSRRGGNSGIPEPRS